jgi:hypothetical protein
MISLILQQAFAGLWAEVWRFGLGFGIIVLLLAAAYLSPIWKKWFLYAALAVGIFMISFTTGVVVGEKRVRAQWAVAEQAAIERGDQARSDAKRAVARKPSRWLRNDGNDIYDRDGAQGAVRGVAPNHLFVR